MYYRKVLILPTTVEEGEISPEGGTFAFLQFFKFDKSVLNDAPQPLSEHMIGRHAVDSEVLARLDEHAHIKRARLMNSKDGSNTELLRQSLPYNVPKPERASGDKGPMSDGTLFVAFGQSSQVFSDILGNILGHEKSPFTQDLMIGNVQGM